MIAICFLLFVFAAILVVSYVCYGGWKTPTALAARLDEQHYPALAPDFFRVGFLNDPVTTLARPGSLRAFVGPSSDFVPGLPLAVMVTYPGLADVPDKNLVAMRCKPTDASVVGPVPATWPNVFEAIKSDLKDKKLPCPPPVTTAGKIPKEQEEIADKDGENKAFCAAQSFQDTPGANATVVLSSAMTAAATLVGDPNAQAWLKKNYGIWPPFSGLGLSVKDSGSSNGMNMNAMVILRKSITTEYLLKNVTLAEAGCRCITVAPYPGRSLDPINPDFVWEKGGDGSCASVKRLN